MSLLNLDDCDPLKKILRYSAFIFIWIIVAANAGAGTEKERLQQFLINDLGLSAKTVSGLDNHAIAEELPVKDRAQENAIIGVVRIDVPKSFFLEKLHNIKSFLRRDSFKQIGSFGTPPQMEDMASFQLPERTLKAMRSCKRSGQCKIKLPVKAIKWFKAFDWSKPNSTLTVNELFRKGLFFYLKRYQKQGNITLTTYADKPVEQSVAEGFDRILQQSPYLYDYIPELYRYLREFPESEPKGIEDRFYWSIEDFGLRPVIEITHVTVYQPEKIGGTLISEKQIYSSHYFWARFIINRLIEIPEKSGGPGLYAIYLERALFDDKLGSMRRSMLSASAIKTLRSRLVTLRDRLEAEFQSLASK